MFQAVANKGNINRESRVFDRFFSDKILDFAGKDLVLNIFEGKLRDKFLVNFNANEVGRRVNLSYHLAVFAGTGANIKIGLPRVRKQKILNLIIKSRF